MKGKWILLQQIWRVSIGRLIYIHWEERDRGGGWKFGRRFLGLKKRCGSREPSNREKRSCRYVSRYSPCHRLISISPHPWLFLNIHFCCLMWTSMATWLFCWIRVLFIYLFIYFFSLHALLWFDNCFFRLMNDISLS